MEFNFLAVFLAAIAGFAIGAIWFGPKTFYPLWWKLMGKSPQEQPGSANMGVVFGLTALGALTQATVMGLVLPLIADASGGLDWLGGMATGALLGLGFSAATSLSHKLFGGFGLRVWILEVGQDIISLAAIGAVIGLFL
ncbi:MAG: hypothetical protein RI917_664 [Actinomycetota bacterium]|jgi:hypothetical protein